jgi:hypothetical protein
MLELDANGECQACKEPFIGALDVRIYPNVLESQIYAEEDDTFKKSQSKYGRKRNGKR